MHRGRYINRANAQARVNFRHPSDQRDRTIPSELGPAVRTIQPKDIDEYVAVGSAGIVEPQYLASYNLLKDESKTILVPGRPPLWSPLPYHDFRLPKDAGQYYRDQNAATFPEYPSEPVVLSIFHMNPQFDPSTVDIVGCASTLGNLLQLARGMRKPFSFTVHVIGNTAFLNHRGTSPTERIEDVVGYGYTFLEANTLWEKDVAGSASHQRIISYHLGGMKLLVRFEADAYVKDEETDMSDGPTETALVAKTLANLQFTPPTSTESDHAVIEDKGSPVKQAIIIDIKTRSKNKLRAEVMAEQLPRLWVRQVKQDVLAFHNFGLFEQPTIDQVTGLNHWELKNQIGIARLANLLAEIKKTAQTAAGGKLEVRYVDGSLQLHELAPLQQENWNAIPEHLHRQWAKI